MSPTEPNAARPESVDWPWERDVTRPAAVGWLGERDVTRLALAGWPWEQHATEPVDWRGEQVVMRPVAVGWPGERDVTRPVWVEASGMRIGSANEPLVVQAPGFAGHWLPIGPWIPWDVGPKPPDRPK